MNRSVSVTLTLGLVLIFIVWNLIKAWTALAWQKILLEFSMQFMPQLNAVISIMWVIVGVILIWGISQKKVWSKKMLIATATSYTVWFWSERLIWQNPKTNTVFTILLNLGILIIIYFATREAYERTIENPEVE